MSKVLAILFNTEMVRAILEGRKTVTRRCVKPKSKNACGFFVITRKSDGAFMGVYDYDENEMMFESPQTQPAYVGDILYVRETWCDDRQFTHDDTPGRYFYKASESDDFTSKWHPSIHMPKEAARIWLKVKDVRVERLQEITEEHAQKEGCQGTFVGDGSCMGSGWDVSPVDEFSKLWDSTIKKSELNRYGWDANPWVWVIEFERCEKPED